MDSRTTALDAKIKKEETELLALKKKIARAKGPTKTRLKKRALAILKRKRMFERQRDQISNQSFNIEQQAFAMESIKDTQGRYLYTVLEWLDCSLGKVL